MSYICTSSASEIIRQASGRGDVFAVGYKCAVLLYS